MGVPPDLVGPLAEWRAANPGRPIADLIRLALLGNPAPSTTTSANGQQHQADEHEHEARELAELRARVDDLARRVDDHERDHYPSPARDLDEYQQRLEDYADTRARAYHATLCAALADEAGTDRVLTAAEAASIWSCVTQSARDRLRMLTALGLATVDDTARTHRWKIGPPSTTTSAA